MTKRQVKFQNDLIKLLENKMKYAERRFEKETDLIKKEFWESQIITCEEILITMKQFKDYDDGLPAYGTKSYYKMFDVEGENACEVESW